MRCSDYLCGADMRDQAVLRGNVALPARLRKRIPASFCGLCPGPGALCDLFCKVARIIRHRKEPA